MKKLDLKALFNKWPYLLTGFILLIMLLLGQRYVNNFYKINTRLYTSQMEPTIFVPGSSATQERFNGTFQKLASMGYSHSVLKITVSKKGTLSYSGAISSREHNPYIVIAFEDNSDSYANIKRQAGWLNTALSEIQTKYRFRRFNAVGHSNGGLVWSFFLEDYWPDTNFQINTLMTIGSPYNLTVTDMNNHTQMLTDLIDDKSNIPKDLTVYNISGSNSYNSDYLVAITSVEAGKYIYQNQVKQYTFFTVTGSTSEHSDLPTNTQVLQYIAQYVLQTGKGQKPTPNNTSK